MKTQIYLFSILLSLISCGKDKDPLIIKNTFIDNNNIINNPSLYNGMDNDKVSIFVDNFNDNSNNWSTETNSDHSFTISNGNYNMVSYGTSLWLCYQSIIVLPDNYELEIKFSIDDNSATNNLKNGIILGATTNLTDYYYFGLNNDLNYIVKSSSETPSFEFPVSPVTINSSGNYNVITIRKYGGNYYFFINNELAKTTSYNAPPGSTTGIFVNGGCSIHVDYIKFYKLL